MTTIVGAVVMTAAMVVQATGGRLVAGEPARVFDGVSIDSRTGSDGRLFIALRGPRFDGHAFLDEACRAGAAGLLVSMAPDDPGSATVVVVPDTLAALQDLARAVRRRSGARVVAITGSAGKTTTKEVTADLLATRYQVFRNRGNLNNHIGLPLSLIELRHGPDLAVVELGMNHAGEIRTLVSIAQPEVRVWTNVGDAHLGQFGTREAVAAAKAEILEQAGAETLVIANADDPLVMGHVRTFTGRRLTFGESAGADVRATAVVDHGFDGTAADVTTAGGTIRLQVPLPGRAHLSNVLAAVAVARAFDIDPSTIARTVATLRPIARRGASVALAGGARLVDDSYNASPAAVEASLQALAATPVRGRRIVVLGEMLELGPAAGDLHERSGRAAVGAGADVLVAVGGAAADRLVAGALAAGLARNRVHRCPDSAAAAALVATLVEPDDLVLVKGSRGTRTDLIADRLQEAG